MNALKLLIVEDEQRTRELLRRYVAWEEIGIHEVVTSKNGLAALELARQWRPDIVLCDVRMPKMDGIEFATHLREIDPDCKIIFLSGFSDKEYLKSAIHLKALSYLEKPVNLDEVRAFVEEAANLLLEERRRLREEKRIQGQFDRSLPFLRQEMVRRLISDPNSGHTREALQREDTFLIPPTGPYTVLAAPLYWSPPDYPENPATVQERLLHAMNTNEKFRAWKALCGFDSHHWLAIILTGAYGSTFGERREVIEELSGELRRMAGERIDIRLGVGHPVRELAQIPTSFRMAYQLGNLQFYREGKRPLYPDSIGGNKPLLTDWAIVRELRDSLRRGEADEAFRILRTWGDKARTSADLDIVRVKDTYFQLLLAILEISYQQGFIDYSEDDERHYIWKEIDRIPSLDRLERYMQTFLQPFAEKPKATESGKLLEIIRYIHGHFHENGFTIHAIANHVNLSETYLCSYFKKQKGMTVKEFITEQRVEKAKELLRNKEMKLFEIALSIGFADPNYFTSFFKRNTGATPTEYRERLPQ